MPRRQNILVPAERQGEIRSTVLRNAGSRVTDHDFQAPACHADCDTDESALRRELRGFVQQADQHLLEAAVTPMWENTLLNDIPDAV